jgi:macrolide transport system ATP-binding/permease protein
MNMMREMNIVRTIWMKLRSAWQRRGVKREIDEELRFHLEQRTAENLAAGMAPEDAAREARKRFGNLQSVREECRETRGANFGEAILQDLRFGARMLAKRPGLTAMAVLSLAIGIGVNSTVFSALNAALLRPLGFKDPETIFRVDAPWSFSYPDYRELSGQGGSLAGLVAVSGHGARLCRGDDVEMVVTEIVSPNYFSVLGIRAAAGSLFAASDPRLQQDERLVVISHRFWQQQFGGDPAIAGKTIPLEDGTYTIMGVAQKDYHGVYSTGKADLWFAVSRFMTQNRDVADFRLLGRRAREASMDQVRAEMKTIGDRMKVKNPFTGKPQQLVVLSESQSNHGGELTLMVMGIVGMVLLVACANVSGMLLSRNEERRREMAVRLALGAGRRRLTRQMLMESLLLALLGGILGLLLTAWSNSAVLALVPANLLAFVPEPHLDGRVLVMIGVLTLLATLVFGLAPAWRAARTDLGTILKGEAAPGPNRWARLRGRDALVVGQLVVSVVFLVTAALLVRAFVRGNAADLGFERKAMLQLLLPGIDGAQGRLLLERIQAVPGVRQASLALRAPLALSGGGATETVFLPRDEAAGNLEGRKIGFNIVAPNYFQVMGISLLRGRSFEDQDGVRETQVAVISDATARSYWPGEDPIGKLIRPGRSNSRPLEVVGVVRDVARIAIGETPGPFLYLPLTRGFGEITLLVEPKGDAGAVLVLVRRELRSFDKRLQPYLVDTQKQAIRVALLPQWAAAWLFGVLGLLAFGMSAAGLYGVVAYSVARRTHEIGVRIALGAQARDTVKLILRQGAVLSLIGLAIGLPTAFGVGRLLQSGLYGIDTADPAIFLGASVLVVVVVLCASFFPARRATRINPMDALRCE